jgi:hypothetical protein
MKCFRMFSQPTRPAVQWSTERYKSDVSWWGNKKVNRAEFKRALTAYSKEIRRLKRKSFARFSEEILDTPVASRLRKVLSKEHSNGFGPLIKADGSRTGDQRENLETFMLTHFPESTGHERSPGGYSQTHGW